MGMWVCSVLMMVLLWLCINGFCWVVICELVVCIVYSYVYVVLCKVV